MWELPKRVDLMGVQYAINTDYRDILDIIGRLQNQEDPEPLRLMIAMAIFYDDWDQIPRAQWQTAAEQMMWFIAGGEDEPDSAPRPKLIDWEQDAGIIVSDINRVAGCEIRALPYLHWWTFLAWFGAIGDGRLSTVVSIRDKLRRGSKLEKWEAKYYRENRNVIDFRIKYTSEEDALLEKLLGREEVK